MQLKDLGCTIPANYSSYGNSVCTYSPYISWINNGQWWWTKSADSEYSFDVWIVSGPSVDVDHFESRSGIRPVITISKTDLENYL